MLARCRSPKPTHFILYCKLGGSIIYYNLSHWILKVFCFHWRCDLGSFLSKFHLQFTHACAQCQIGSRVACTESFLSVQACSSRHVSLVNPRKIGNCRVWWSWPSIPRYLAAFRIDSSSQTLGTFSDSRGCHLSRARAGDWSRQHPGPHGRCGGAARHPGSPNHAAQQRPGAAAGQPSAGATASNGRRSGAEVEFWRPGRGDLLAIMKSL